MHARWLRAGDAVAVVSPSGPSDPTEIAAGVAWLGARYRIAHDPRRAARDGYLAGSDSERAGALLEAIEDPSVRAIVAVRGGYGATRVLELAGDRLLAALSRDPKPLVGFSDVTALHAVWARAGVCSIHGPMVAAIGRGAVPAADRDAVVTALEGGVLAPWPVLQPWVDGAASGRACGGNLAVLAALQGTPHAMPVRDRVLFLEDVGERPYRVDRMLTTLRASGALRSVAAIVLGDFTECGPGPDGVTVEQVLRERCTDLGVPVFAAGGFGHGPSPGVFVLGTRVHLEPGGIVRFGHPGERPLAEPSGS